MAITNTTNKHLEINGVTLYPITDALLTTALNNTNAVILLADIDNPHKPVFYQRYCDYLDSLSITKLRLTEAHVPYDINPIQYPVAHALYTSKMKRATQ